MGDNKISEAALRLADEFLHRAREQILGLADGDLKQLRASAEALRASAKDRSTQRKSGEQIAYALVASAFNEALTNRTATPPGMPEPRSVIESRLRFKMEREGQSRPHGSSSITDFPPWDATVRTRA